MEAIVWQVVRDDPEELIRRYAESWTRLQSEGKEFYYELRERFNRTHDPYLFFFLLWSCRNGLVRFNRDGEFNSGFHGARPGMAPEFIEAILADWWGRLGSREVHFAVRDYREVSTGAGDLIYLDPPYLNEDGQYYCGMIDFPEFFGWLRDQRGDHLLSLNGFLGDEDRTVAVPGDLYDKHLLLDNGVCTFDRLNGEAAPPMTDSLYTMRGRRSLGRRRRWWTPPQSSSSPSSSSPESRMLGPGVLIVDRSDVQASQKRSSSE